MLLMFALPVGKQATLWHALPIMSALSVSILCRKPRLWDSAGAARWAVISNSAMVIEDFSRSVLIGNSKPV